MPQGADVFHVRATADFLGKIADGVAFDLLIVTVGEEPDRSLILLWKPLFGRPGRDRLGCLATGLFKGGKKQRPVPGPAADQFGNIRARLISSPTLTFFPQADNMRIKESEFLIFIISSIRFII